MLLGSSHSALMGPSPSEFTRSSGNASRTVLPAFSASSLATSTMREAWSADRASIQRRHGRRGLRSASSATTEQHVVSQQIAATSSKVFSPSPPAAAAEADATAPLTAEQRRSYHSSGLCSAHPARGWDVAYPAAYGEPTTAPVAASKQQARTDSVPPSTPMTTFLLPVSVDVDDDATRSSSETRRIRRIGVRRGPRAGREGWDAIMVPLRRERRPKDEVNERPACAEGDTTFCLKRVTLVEGYRPLCREIEASVDART